MEGIQKQIIKLLNVSEFQFLKPKFQMYIISNSGNRIGELLPQLLKGRVQRSFESRSFYLSALWLRGKKIAQPYCRPA